MQSTPLPAARMSSGTAGLKAVVVALDEELLISMLMLATNLRRPEAYREDGGGMEVEDATAKMVVAGA